MAEPSAIAPLFDRYQLRTALGRTPWYRQYTATDLKQQDEVIVKVLRLEPGQQRTSLEDFRAWYASSLAGVPGVVLLRSIHLDQDQLYVIERPATGQPWRTVMAESLGPEGLKAALHSLLERFEGLHQRCILHNCLLPENLWFDRRLGWQLADCGWLRWCCLNGYVPAEAVLPEAWTAMADGHQLGALLAYTALKIEISSADVPLRATSELKRRARQLPSPYPAMLMQLWGPAITEEWSPMQTARLVLEGRTDIPPPEKAHSSPRTESFEAAERVPVTGSISYAAAISAGAVPGAATAIGRSLSERMSEERPAEVGATGGSLAMASPAAPLDRRGRLRESTQFAKTLFVTLLVSLAFSAGLLYALSAFLFKATVTAIEVPDVVGMTISAAKKEVEPKGFSITLQGAEYSQEVPRDKILRQSPGPKTTVKEFREIFVTLSRGARDIKLPSLIGLEEAAAIESLTKLELKPGRISREYTRGVPEGQVIDQDPPANQQLAKEEAVNLVISRGALKGELQMPILTNRPLSTALSILSDSGLTVRKIVRHYDYEATSVTVALQSPIAGSVVEEGDTVSLTVTAPKSQEPLGDFQLRVAIALPAFEGQREVRVLVRDGRGEHPVYTKQHSGGDKVEVLADAYQSTTVRIYVDGKLLREEQY